MSVYTSVSKSQLDSFLLSYDLGNLVQYQGISAGVTNSNYELETTVGQFVLTLYEHHKLDELDYILSLQHHLADNGVACSAPMGNRKGQFYAILNNKPAAIMNRVAGEVNVKPEINHCAKIATELARFHIVGQSFETIRPNPRGLDWCREMAKLLKSELSKTEIDLIEDFFLTADRLKKSELPMGAIHADLFHDNSLFEGETLGGIIDFDFACYDYFIFDLAVTINDWCVTETGELDQMRLNEFINAYQKVRPLNVKEQHFLPVMLRLAALRFWLSRLYDKSFPRTGELIFIKCPDQYKNMLKLRLRDENRVALEQAWLFSNTKAGKYLSQ